MTPSSLVPSGIDAAFGVPGTAGPLIYFVRGGWAVEHDAGAVAPPLRGAAVADLWPKLPAAYRGGFDGACATDGPEVHFFQGATTVRYDVVKNEPVGGTSPVPIGSRFPGLNKDAPDFTQGIDAGVPNPDGTLYLFRGERCVVYDPETDEVLDHGTIAEIWRTPEFPDAEVYQGVVAAFSHPATSNGYLVTRDGVRAAQCNTDRSKITSAPGLLRERWPYRTFLSVTDNTEELLRVYDAASGQQILQTTIGRSGQVTFSVDGFLGFAPVYRDRSLVVCDLTAGTVDTVDLGGSPYGVTALPDGSAVYVGDLDGPQIRSVDLATGAVTSIQAGGTPSALVAAPDSRSVYVSCRGSGDVAVVDTASGTVVRRLGDLTTPTDVVVTPDGRNLAVLDPTSGSSFVALLTTSGTGTARLVPTGRDLMGIAAFPDSRTVYAADLGPEVRVIDVPSASQKGTVTTTGRASSVAVTPEGDRLFVVAYTADVVQIFDPVSGERDGEIPLGSALTDYGYLSTGLAWG
ncbi:cell surface protein [Streptomyces sp. NPDC004838]